MDHLDDAGEQSSIGARGLDRRQLLRAGAWATPVVLIAAATPAVSASGVPPVPIQVSIGNVYFGWVDGVASVLKVEAEVEITLFEEPGRDVTELTLSVFFSATDGFYQVLKDGVPSFHTQTPVPWTYVETTGDGGTVTFLFRWTGTLNSFDNFRTGKVVILLPARDRTNLRAFEPIAWTMTASSPDSTTAVRRGAVTTLSDPTAPGFSTLTVPATAAITDVDISGDNARIHVSGSVSEAVTVTAFLLITPTAGSTAGVWQEEVNGSNDGSKPRTITVNALPGQPTVFEFPTYQGVNGSSYTFLIIYNWGQNEEFQKATTGSFAIAH